MGFGGLVGRIVGEKPKNAGKKPEKLPPENEWNFKITMQSSVAYLVDEVRMCRADERSFEQFFGGVYAGYFAQVPCPKDAEQLPFYQQGLIIGYKARESGLEEAVFKQILVSNYPYAKV